MGRIIVVLVLASVFHEYFRLMLLDILSSIADKFTINDGEKQLKQKKTRQSLSITLR